MHRILTVSLVALFASLLPVRPLAAQSCTTDDPPCPPNEAPRLSMSAPPAPAGKRTVTVTVSASDEYRVDPSTLSFKQNGTSRTLTTEYFPPGVPTNIVGTVSITLSGTDSLSALSLYACDTATPALCETIYDTVAYVPAPPLSAAPQNLARRFLGGCAGCAPGLLSYSTPAYMSLDTPREATLFFSTEQSKPVGFIQLDANINSSVVPQWISVRVEDPTGPNYITLSNDSTVAYFQGDTGVLRIAAQFPLAGMETGARTFIVYVKAKYASTESVASMPIRVLTQNEASSSYGRGWTVAGAERIHFVGDSLLIANGAGLLEYFTKISCTGSPQVCSYASPIGDLTTITKHAPIVGFDSATFTRTFPDGSTTVYLPTGLMRHKRDRFGNETKVVWTTLGNGATVVSSIIDPAGKTTTFAYAGSGGSTPKPYTLTGITLPDGRVSSFSVNGTSGDLTAIDDPDGVDALDVTYTDHRPTAWLPRGMGTFNATYDGMGQIATIQSPAVDSLGTGPRPMTTITSLRGRLLPTSGQGTTSSALASKSKLHPDSAYAMVAAQSGAKVRTWGHRSGGAARVETIDAAGKKLVERWTYTAGDRLESHINARNGVTVNAWVGALLESSYDGTTGVLTELFYGPHAQTSEVKINGVTMQKAFFTGSNALYPDSVRSDTAHVTKFTWDSRGRPLTVRPSSTELSTIAYQSTGFLNTQSVTVAVTGESNRVTSFTYNSRGLMQTTTDPTSRTSTVYRDVMNRDSVQIGSQGDTSRWTYNGANRTVTFRDALTYETKTKFNLIGWPIERTDPRTKVDRFAYDSLGNLITTVTRKGATISFAYDALGRMLKQKWSTDSILVAYDTAGRWVAFKNAESTDTLYTDAKGRPIQSVTVRGTQRFTVAYGYTDDGTLYRRAVSAGGGSSPVTWGPDTLITGTDAAMRLAYLQEFGGKATGFTYDRQERVSQIALPTSTTPSARVKRQLTYGNGGRVTLDKYVNADALTRAYPSYDDLGRLLEIADSASPATKHRLFTYDSRGRLASYSDVERSTYWYCDTPEDELECEATGYWVNDETTIRSSSYTYDRLGNRTDLGGLTATGNRLVRFDGDSMTYDDGGFLTRRWKIAGGTDRRYYWNAIGQLDSVRVVGGALTSYGYDGLGRRVRKTVDGVTTRYLLDGDHVITELASTNQVAAHYTYYPGVDQPHSMRRDGSTYYFAYDLSGQVTALLNSGGTVVRTYIHSPLGGPIAETGSVQNSSRSDGRAWDAESGLYYNRARFYEPAAGRFISEDPIGLAGGVNPYQYAVGDPVNLSDPSGLKVCLDRGETMSKGDWLEMIETIEEATNTKTWWKEGCLVGFMPRARNPRDFHGLQDVLSQLHHSKRVFTLEFLYDPATSHSPQHGTYRVSVSTLSGRHDWALGSRYGLCAGEPRAFTLPHVMAHELIHAAHVVESGRRSPPHLKDYYEERAVLRGDNPYFRGRHELSAGKGSAPQRCTY